MSSTKQVLVLYHANCPDGFCAAWVAHRVLGDEADYLPVQYGQDPPDVTDRNVFILDFSYKRPVMLDLLEKANHIVVLDHHKTAEAELSSLSHPRLFVRFDMDKSGGRLTWEHFCRDESSPWLVDYTEDRDLWRWRLEESRKVNAGLAIWPRTFEEWDRIARDSTAVSYFAQCGETILLYQKQQVDAICANAREIEMDGHQILAVNTSVLFSEVAGKLAEGRPFGAAWFERGDGKVQWSLRSRDGGIDVSEVARRRGGGGHRNAAGFEVGK